MRRNFIVCLLLLVMALCTGCDTYAIAERYPEDQALHWHCEEIGLKIEYTYNENNMLEIQSFPLEHDGEIVMANIGFMANSFQIDRDTGNQIISEDDLLLAGTWTYRGDNLVLQIEEDNVFNGTYTELVFIPCEK